jgi:uncharacterized protein (TIGR03067 family)
MRPSLFAGAVLALVTAAPTAADDAADLKALQGRWTPVSVTHDGKEVPIGTGSAAFDGGMMTVTEGDSKKTWKFKLDTGKTPHEIDILPQDGPDKGKTVRGIYELKGDALRLCFGRPDADRPTAFASKAGERAVLVEFERKK